MKPDATLTHPEGPATACPARVRRFADLPGPPPWPVVGNALQVSLHRMHQNMEDWVKAYGPLMQVRLAGFHLMVVADTELIGHLLRERPETFRRPSRMQAIMREMGIPDGVFVAEGEHWARQRRMVMASFAPQQVRSYFPALLKVAQRLRGRWQGAAERTEAIDLQAELMRFTVDAIAGLAFGVDVNTLQSDDDGRTWTPLGLLHDDDSPSEHGFVSYVPLAAGVQAFWLDGRAMGELEGGAMELRTGLLASGKGTPPSLVLDRKVCECCSTDAALTAAGPVVVYRDRSDAEIRDIALVRKTTSGWSSPSLVSADNWQIHGCPVNGPAVAADGDIIAVAWFTGSDARPRVQVAFALAGGTLFDTPLLLDAERPVGRVDIALDSQGTAQVLWMGRGGEIQLQSVDPAGTLGPRRRIAKTSATRAAGFPTLVKAMDRLVLVWKDGAALRGAALSL
ncbi:MAG: cytochrome P450 [Proteobacteria bacterium]|nr:cytochrome P450 [Pseudomonadota bacterium]